MTKFVALKAKTYGYLIDDDSENKKENDRKSCVKKKNYLNFKIIKTI